MTSPTMAPGRLTSILLPPITMGRSVFFSLPATFDLTALGGLGGSLSSGPSTPLGPMYESLFLRSYRSSLAGRSAMYDRDGPARDDDEDVLRLRALSIRG